MEKVKGMTKKEMFERVIEIVKGANVADEAVLVEKLEHEVELVSKKRATQTKAQKENEVLVEKVFDAIVALGKPVTNAQIFDELRGVEGITSSQKVAALVSKLETAGKIVKVKDKKTVLISVAE